MFTKIAIALTAFLVVASVASAQEWQPSWAHDPIPLVNGQEYKTGSPLSRPGLLGLFGGIANGLTGGALPEFTGGGSLVWQGQGFTCAGLEINGECLPTMTHDQAQGAMDGATAVDNALYATTERQCNKSKSEMMKLAMKMHDQGITAFDCDGNPIESASTGCNGQLTVAYVQDETLGVRAVYTCQE